MHLFSFSLRYVSRIAISGCALFFTVACKDGTAPKVPASIEFDASAPSATAGLVLATPLTFSVKDAAGAILGGVPVTVSVTAGGGTLTGNPSVTASGGPTSIGTWTLGRVAGLNTVTVTVGNLAPLLFNVNGVAGPPAAVAIVGGNLQTAVAGSALPTAVTAQVRDQFGNGVSGSLVTFSVTSGGGSLSASTATSDGNGNAGGIRWTLGKSAAPQLAIASSSGFTADVTAVVRSDYNVDVRFFGPTPQPEAMAAFTDAAARVRGAVIGDVPDVNIPLITANAGLNLGQCGVSGVVLNEVVDDLVVYATVTSIDGPGKVLASAGPCYVRQAGGTDCVPTATPPATCNSFSIVGVMRFDADDIAGLVSTGRLNGVVLHEMLHVVGVGTNWRAKSLLTGQGSVDPRFRGALGVGGCNEAGGTITCATGIPVENIGGSGTADAHWRESVFRSELMTGFSEAPGIPTPFSNMTIQSLADEGYVVNPFAADPYTIPTPAGISGIRGNVISADRTPFDTVLMPMFSVSKLGTIRKLITQ